MARSFGVVIYGAVLASSLVLFGIGPPGREGAASPTATQAAAGQSTPSPAAISGGGVTLRSVKVDLPDSDRLFQGPGADVVNNNCLACHSAGMALTQPRLPRAVWQAEVEKMRNTYKAPIAAEDVPAIVDYLAKLPE
jgi:cytochrome c5